MKTSEIEKIEDYEFSSNVNNILFLSEFAFSVVADFKSQCVFK